MSVLVKGMRMPENCIKCPMQFGGMCYVMPAEVDESRVAPTVEEALKQGKPDWCPLIEIPEPHGDLIDRDAIEADILPEWNGLYVPDNAYSEKLICNAPTVIPREDGERNDES